MTTDTILKIVTEGTKLYLKILEQRAQGQNIEELTDEEINERIDQIGSKSVEELFAEGMSQG